MMQQQRVERGQGLGGTITRQVDAGHQQQGIGMFVLLFAGARRGSYRAFALMGIAMTVVLNARYLLGETWSVVWFVSQPLIASTEPHPGQLVHSTSGVVVTTLW